MSVTHTSEQNKALKAIQTWWNNGAPTTPEFLLFGFAGTGKTTIIKELPSLLNLGVYEDREDTDEEGKSRSPINPDAGRCMLYCAFTGKAASVLKKKGVNAFTIHQSIYGRPIINEVLLAELTDKLNAMEKNGDPLFFATLKELKKTIRPGFASKAGDTRASCSMLLVIDECSMIDEFLYRDLVATGIPMIFTGDPAQLPPVGKTAGLIERRPDSLLTEIHRQAADNPILQIATHLRTSHILPKIAVPEIVITNDIPPIEQMAEFDQVLVGYHTSRRRLNNGLRKFYQYDTLPQGKGEKLINLKNDHTLGIMNGEMVTLTDLYHDDTPLYFKGKLADFYTQVALGGHYAVDKLIYNGHFWDTVAFKDGRIERDWRERKDATELDWGYAITCHKSQGSEWDSVLVNDDGFGRSNEDRRRWLYTAVTRARSTVYVSSRFAV